MVKLHPRGKSLSTTRRYRWRIFPLAGPSSTLQVLAPGWLGSSLSSGGGEAMSGCRGNSIFFGMLGENPDVTSLIAGNRLLDKVLKTVSLFV